MRRSSPIQSWANPAHVDFSEREQLPGAGQVRPSRRSVGTSSSCPRCWAVTPLEWHRGHLTAPAWHIPYCHRRGVTVLCPLALLGCARLCVCLALAWGGKGPHWGNRTQVSEWLWMWGQRPNLAFQRSQSCFRATLTKSLMLFVLVQLLWSEHLSID